MICNFSLFLCPLEQDPLFEKRLALRCTKTLDIAFDVMLWRVPGPVLPTAQILGPNDPPAHTINHDVGRLLLYRRFPERARYSAPCATSIVETTMPCEILPTDTFKTQLVHVSNAMRAELYPYAVVTPVGTLVSARGSRDLLTWAAYVLPVYTLEGVRSVIIPKVSFPDFVDAFLVSGMVTPNGARACENVSPEADVASDTVLSYFGTHATCRVRGYLARGIVARGWRAATATTHLGHASARHACHCRTARVTDDASIALLSTLAIVDCKQTPGHCAFGRCACKFCSVSVLHVCVIFLV